MLPPAAAQSSIQNAFARRNAARSLAVTRAAGSARNPFQAANAEADAYGEPTLSGGPSGSTCHQLCPAAASQSTNA